MSVITYLNWVSAVDPIAPGGYDFTNFNTPNIGQQGWINHEEYDTSTLPMIQAGGAWFPVDAVALLGTTLDTFGADEIGILVMAGSTIILDEPLAPIVNTWPVGKARSFVWRIPRGPDGMPQWVDRVEVYVRFQGIRFFGGCSVGPGFVFGPTIGLEYNYDDSPAKMERAGDTGGWPAEYTPRRTITLGTENAEWHAVFSNPQYTAPPPPGKSPPFMVELQCNLQTILAQYLNRGSRVLLLPIEEGPYVSRCAEYGRLVTDPTVRQLAGNKMALAFQFAED